MSSRSSRDRPRGSTARTVAQAKLNLFLHVVAREASGYHQLETLFCRLDLGDDVTVRTGVRGRSLDCAGETLPPGGLGPVEQNLAWRAAVAFADATGWPNDWSIEVTKRIPVGGGLGGGSADAGAVLRCLNALAPEPVDANRLLAMAVRLGADVSFLTLEHPFALAWGRGERMLAIPALPACAVTLVCFPFGVATREAFGWIDAERSTTGPVPISRDVKDLVAWTRVAASVHNDFEAVVARQHPEIARVLDALRRDAFADPDGFAMLTGSGSTVALVSAAQADHERARDGRLDGVAPRIVRAQTATAVVGVEVSG
jgi:4-diphosphocytidyl-2-C-methyl-D-erythritol kinase